MIEKVVNQDLCTGCGTCYSICKNNAISIVFDPKKSICNPKVNHDICKYCKLCYNICPRNENYQENLKVNLNRFDENPIGQFSNCYLASSNDINIRYNKSSGGLVTQLLIYAIENKIIDGAIITKAKKNNPFKNETFIARTKKEIIEAATSKYSPTNVNINLKRLMKTPNQNYAFVGLPCHLEGLKKAEEFDKSLEEKIIFRFGLFCSHTLNFRATDYLLNHNNVKKEDVVNISYRGKGWPGKIEIKLKKGKNIILDNDSSMWFTIFNSFLFTPKYCLICNDLTGESSDISFGDPWLPEMKNESCGKSLLICRTEKGKKLLENAKNENYIDLTETDHKKVILSQAKFLHFKKKNLAYRIKNKKINFHDINKKSIIFNYLLSFFSLFNSSIGSSKIFTLIKFIPFKILNIYAFFISYLMSLTTIEDCNKFNEMNNLNVFIINANWNNRGDEAAIRAMIDTLNSEFNIEDIKIMISSLNIEYFPYNTVKIVDLYPKLEKNFFPMIILFLDIFITIISIGKYSISSNGKKFLSAISKADFILSAPGGAGIGELNKGKYGIDEFFYLYRFLIPILKGKPIFIYATSIGPFSSKLKNLFRKFILNRVDTIILREKFSSNYLKDTFRIESYTTIDAALQNQVPTNYLKRDLKYINISNLLNFKNTIGMTITDLQWHSAYKNNFIIKENITNSLSKLVAYLIQKNYTILLIPQLFGDNDAEMKLLNKIKNINNERIYILPTYFDAYSQQIIISKLFCVIGMRYHPNIFAAKSNVPSIAISYEHKLKGFMEILGRNDLLINVKEISSEKLIEKFKYLEKNRLNLIKEINKKQPELKKLSKKTNIILKNRLQELGLYERN